MFGVVLVVAVLAGCGRVGFDVPSGDAAGVDAPLPAGRWAKVSVADLSTCAITTTAELWCWGFGYYGQLGIGALATTAPPTKVGDGWREVAVASDHACGIKTDGTVWCWGEDDYGQLGDNMQAFAQVAPRQVVQGIWTQIAVGYETSCALAADQHVWCWGRNDLGQLGNGTNVQANVPGQIAGTWTAIVAGQAHFCALRAAGSTVWCWGQNGSRQLGTGDTIDRNTPTPVSFNTVFAQVAAGSTFTCGIEPGGQTSCWGDGEVGQLGVTTTNGAATPVAQPGPGFTTVGLGARHGCGIASSGLWCWGAGQRGALAELAQLAVTVPTQLAATHPVQVSAGGSTTCYIDDVGHLFCTGANGGGQTGQPHGEVHAVVRSDARTDWAKIYAHRGHACGTRTDGSAACWGSGLDGEIGDGGYFDRQVPIDLALTNFTALDIGAYTTGGVAGGIGYEWGYDFTVDQHNPTPKNFGASLSLGLGELHGCSLAGTTLTCGGANNAGQLGDGTTTFSVSTTVPGAWQSVHASASFTCGVQANGAGQLYCWGSGAQGEVGAGTLSNFPTPQLVPLGSPVSVYALGGGFACALPGGELDCWGANDRGQIGDASGTLRASPVRVGLATNWIALAAGDLHACGIQSDHSLWCWGHCDEGQLGDASTVDVLTPQRVGSDMDWMAVAAGDHFTCALKLDGTRWCFGANYRGELGNGAAWLTGFAVVP